MNLKQHPLSAAFPPMGADDFAALVEDIRANGQREPVIVFEGMVLDGWHRYSACVEIGIKAQQFTFAEGKDPVAFVLSQNLHRRHLTGSQRAAAVVACTEWAPAHRPKKGETISPFSTNDALAKAANVSDRTIKDAKVAHKAGLTDAVKSGAITVNEAAKIARGTPAKSPRKLDNRADDVPELTDADELAEMGDTVRELAEENDRLRDKLAVESLMEHEEAKTQTANTIADLRAQVKSLDAVVQALTVSRDTYMREATEAKKDAIYWRKKAEKAEKARAAA